MCNVCIKTNIRGRETCVYLVVILKRMANCTDLNNFNKYIKLAMTSADDLKPATNVASKEEVSC